MFLLLSGCQTLPPAQFPHLENSSSILNKTTFVIKGEQLYNYTLKGLTDDENYSSSWQDKEYQVMGNNIFIKGTPPQRNTSLQRVSWEDERFSSSEQNEEYQITKSNKDDYVLKLDIKTSNDINVLSGLSTLLLYTPQLVGVPEWQDVTVSISADLFTKYGEHIKNYKSQGTTKRNIAGLLYGYNVFDAVAKSQQESFNEAFIKLREQINDDKHIKQEAQKKLNIEKKAIAELKNITKGKKIYDMKAVGNMAHRGVFNFDTLEKGSIIYFYRASIPSYGYHAEQIGLFAGQNTANGNLADYHSVSVNYAGLNFNSEKIFLYGKNDYIDGRNIEGYYKYVDDFNYITVLGVRKTVLAFRKVTIRKELEKYFDFINN